MEVFKEENIRSIAEKKQGRKLGQPRPGVFQQVARARLISLSTFEDV